MDQIKDPMFDIGEYPTFAWERLKMTGGTLEVRSDKSLTLLTFDISLLTFDI